MKTTIDSLLAETAWIQDLARRLVADPDLARELAQESWVAALRRPPDTERPLRGWLATVVRNTLASRRRRDADRSATERAVSREEAQPSTLDLVERASTHRDVVQAVLELDEPFRTTLLARFYEGLSYPEIARRLGVERATVNSRITRGLRQLRAKLEAEYGDRRSLAVALVPLARGGARTKLAAGTLGGVALVVATASTAVWWRMSSGAADAPMPAVEVAQGALLAEEPEPVPAPAPTPRTPREVAPAPPAPELPAEPPALAVEARWSRTVPLGTEVQVVTVRGADAELRLRGRGAGSREIQVEANVFTEPAGGDFEAHFALSESAGAVDLAVRAATSPRRIVLTLDLPTDVDWIVETGNGPLLLEDPGRDVRVDAGTGTVRVSAAEVARLQVKAGAGDVLVRAGSVAGLLDVDAGRGDVRVTLDEPRSPGRVALTSASGAVDLLLPYDVQGRIAAEAARGTVDVPRELDFRAAGDRWTATLGAEGGDYELTTDRGSILLRLR